MPVPGDELTDDHVDALRRELGQRFAGDATLGRAIDAVAGDIAQAWADSNGIEPASFDLLNAEMGPL